MPWLMVSLVTPRPGLVVEVNALWYNAVCQALAMGKGDEIGSFYKSWKPLPELDSGIHLLISSGIRRRDTWLTMSTGITRIFQSGPTR